MKKRILMTTMVLVVSGIGFGQTARQRPAIDPPVHTVPAGGTLRIRLNGAVTDWLLGANVAPAHASAKLQVFEIDRDYPDTKLKRIGQGIVKAVSYPSVNVSANTVQVNDVGSHDTTALYVEASAWTTIIVTGPKDEVLYQTPLRKTVLVSRGVEFDGPKTGDFRMLLPWSDRTHEARLPHESASGRSILHAGRVN